MPYSLGKHYNRRTTILGFSCMCCMWRSEQRNLQRVHVREMASIFYLAVLVVFAGCSEAQDPPGGFYTTRYDHIDVENILNQKRLVYYYTQCLLDRGPCTPQGIEFKRILPEAIRTNCMRCTEKQRFVTMKTIRRLIKEYPDAWSQLAAVWDPTGAYIKEMEDTIAKKYNRTPEVTGSASNVENSLPVQPVQIPVIGSRSNFGPDETPSIQATTPRLIETTTRRLTTTQRATTTERTTTTQRTTTNQRKTTTRRAPTRVTVRAISATEQETSKPSSKRGQPAEPNTTAKRLIYNYDFAVTTRPPVQRQQNGGFNVVLKGVNNIIAPITDIAGKVISAGTDFAGMVLDAFGVRKV